MGSSVYLTCCLRFGIYLSHCFLEHRYGSNFTDKILNNSGVSLRSLKERVLKANHLHLISQAKVHTSQRHVLEVSTNIGWLRIWDNALDYGPSCTISSLSVLKLLCKTVFVDRACPVENCDFVVPPDCVLCEHFLHAHTNLNIDFTSSLSSSMIALIIFFTLV